MNSKRRKLLFLLFFLLVFGIYYLLEKREKSPDLAEHNVLSVIDGDTVIIDDGKKSRIRYLGIDTPEIAYQGSPGDPMSEEAKDFNAKLVQGKTVKLEFDEEKYDVYGRILAYVYVDDLLVNEELLKEGLATALIIEPNGMYSEIIFDALQQAKNNKKGIWGDLRNLVPPPGNSEFRVDLNKAHRYEGKRIVVKGRILDVRKSDNVIVLNMEDKLDVVIFPDDWNNFEYFGIDPEKFYKSRTVEVIGRVKMRRGKPGIIVDHPMLLRSSP